MPLTPLRPKFRLRTTLIVPFVLQIVAAVGLVGYLSFRNGQQAVTSLANQLSNQVSSRVSQQLNQYLATPRQVNEINLQAINLGMLKPQELDTTGRFFWKQMQLSENLGYINFGNQQGLFVGVGRNDDGSLYIDRMRSSDRRYTTYALDEQGNPTRFVESLVYPFQQDEWYKSAVTAGRPVWSPIYQWEDTPEVIAISSSYPVYDSSKRLVGVLGVDFILSQISNFLRSLHISPSSKIFVMERNGMLVASSSQEKPYQEVNGKAQRLNIAQSQDPLIRNVAQQLRDRFSTFNQITTPQLLSLKLNQEQAFVSVTPWQDALGLNWLVVVVIPESDFMGQINVNTRNTILLCLAALGVAIASGILTTRWVTRPILEISQASTEMAQGDVDQHVASSNLIEIDRLATSFNNMAARMKQSLNTLRQTEARNQAVLNAIPDLILRIHQDGRYLDVLEAKAVRMIANRENRIGKSVYDILPTELAQQYLHYIHQAIQSNETQRFEYQLLSGERLGDYEARVVKSGETEAILIVQDITERKQAEAALVKGEERFRGLVANIPGAIYRCQCDDDRMMGYISDAIETISGYSASDFIQNQIRTYTSVIHPDDRDLVEVIINHGIITQEPYVLDYRVLHQDGSIRWVYEQGQAVFDADDNPLYLDGAIFDITERKQAEENLLQSEATNRALIAAIPDLLIRMKGDGTYLGITNSDHYAVLNVDKSNAGNTSVYDLLPFEAAEHRMHYVRQALQTGELQFYEQQLVIDGSLEFEEVRIVVTGEDEVLAIVRNITDRKLAEQALRQSEATNRALVNAIPDLLLRVNRDGTYLDDAIGASRVKRFAGDNFALNRTTVYDSLPFALAKQRMEAIQQALETKSLQVYEQQLLIGEQLIDEEVRIVVTGEDEAMVMVRDISDRKRAEESLRIAEENYRSIFENALEGIFQSSPEGRFMRVNPAMAEIYGYDSPQEMIDTITDINAQIYADPEDQIRFQDQMEEYDQVKDFEYRVYQKDSGIIWIQEDTRAVRDNAGHLLYYEGMIQNITDRKRKEDELRRQLAELKIEIDQKKREKEVALLTESSYFQEVQQEIAAVNLDEFWS